MYNQHIEMVCIHTHTLLCEWDAGEQSVASTFVNFIIQLYSQHGTLRSNKRHFPISSAQIYHYRILLTHSVTRRFFVIHSLAFSMTSNNSNRVCFNNNNNSNNQHREREKGSLPLNCFFVVSLLIRSMEWLALIICMQISACMRTWLAVLLFDTLQ